MEEKKRSVLVVDDDPAHRYSIGRRLATAGFRVVEADNGTDALQLAPGVDAILLDVHLPDMTGFEVCRRLRENEQLLDVPIIHISAAYVAAADLVQGLRTGADAYLTRPVDDEVVVANLQAVLRLRENLSRLTQELEETRRNEERARDLFIAVLGHDLRNPLDAISMSTQLLARVPASPDVVEQTTTRISSVALRMKHMLDDIQDYARSRLDTDLELRLAPQRLGELAAQAIDELRAASPRVRIELSSEGPDDGVWDGPRVSRVITNQLRNAIQHGEQGSPVYVEVTGLSESRALTVRNAGAAITQDVMARLFQPMAKRITAAPSASNMGLGLFVCKEIVSAHGGHITLTSGEEGTAFRVELPIVSTANTSPSA